MALTYSQLVALINADIVANNNKAISAAKLRNDLLQIVDFANVAAAAGWGNGGNSFGVPGSIGTNDNHSLSFKTNGNVAGIINANGNWRFGTGSVNDTYKSDVQGKTQSLEGYYIDNTGNVALNNVMKVTNPNSGTRDFSIKANTFGVEGWSQLMNYGGSNLHGLRWNPTDGLEYIYANGVKWCIKPTTGNVLINTTTDAGFKFTVNGTSSFKNHLTMDTDMRVQFGGSNAYMSSNGSSVVTFYAFNGVNFLDGGGAYFLPAVSSGPTTAAAIPRPLAMGWNAPHQCAGAHVRTDYGGGNFRGGILLDPLTTTQRDLISSKQAGLIGFNSTTGKFEGWDGTAWQQFH